MSWNDFRVAGLRFLTNEPESQDTSPVAPRGFGIRTMQGKVNEVHAILDGAPQEVLFAALDTVWRRECPDQPSMLLMREVLQQASNYSNKLEAKGGQQDSEHHKVAKTVVRLATMPEDGSGELNCAWYCMWHSFWFTSMLLVLKPSY